MVLEVKIIYVPRYVPMALQGEDYRIIWRRVPCAYMVRLDHLQRLYPETNQVWCI